MLRLSGHSSETMHDCLRFLLEVARNQGIIHIVDKKQIHLKVVPCGETECTMILLFSITFSSIKQVSFYDELHGLLVVCDLISQGYNV